MKKPRLIVGFLQLIKVFASPQVKKRSKKKESQHGPRPQKAAGSSHRGIPSWEEAVGMVIAANQEARSKKPSEDTSSRARGSRSRSGKEKTGKRQGKSS